MVDGYIISGYLHHHLHYLDLEVPYLIGMHEVFKYRRSDDLIPVRVCTLPDSRYLCRYLLYLGIRVVILDIPVSR